MIFMGSKKNIPIEKKVMINYLYYNTEWSIFKISRFLKVCYKTVHNYKNFNLESIQETKSIKKRVSKKIISKSKIIFTLEDYQKLIQNIYNDFKKLNHFQKNPMNLRNHINRIYWKKYYNDLMYGSESPIKGSGKIEILNRLVKDIMEKYKEEDKEKNIEKESSKTSESKISIGYDLEKIKDLLGYNLFEPMEFIKIMDLLRYHAPFYKKNADKRSKEQRIKFIESNMMQDFKKFGFKKTPDIIDEILMNGDLS